MHTKFWLEILKGGDYPKDVGVDGRMILKGIFGKRGWRVWIGFIGLRIWTGGGLL
jgi:hypothetical protein